MKPAIELHIERLVLEGQPFSGANSKQFQRALELEVGRLLRKSAHALHALNSGALSSLPAVDFIASRPLSLSSFGFGVANSLYHALSREMPAFQTDLASTLDNGESGHGLDPSTGKSNRALRERVQRASKPEGSVKRE